MVKSKDPFFSILSLGVFVYFWKKVSIPFYPHRFSQITHYLLYISHWGCFILQKFSSILTLHLLPDQNGIRGGECHTLRSKTLEIKNLSTLAGILLIRGTMGYHFLLSFLFFFFSGGYRGTPNSTAGYLSIFFCEVVEHLLLFISSKYLYFCIAHASNAIILRKSESFWINVLILGAW